MYNTRKYTLLKNIYEGKVLMELFESSNMPEKAQEEIFNGNIVLACEDISILPEALSHFLEKTTGNIYCLLSDRTEINHFVNRVDQIYNGRYNKEMGRRVFFAYGDISEGEFSGNLKEQVHQLIKDVFLVIPLDKNVQDSSVTGNIQKYADECKASFHVYSVPISEYTYS